MDVRGILEGMPLTRNEMIKNKDDAGQWGGREN